MMRSDEALLAGIEPVQRAVDSGEAPPEAFSRRTVAPPGVEPGTRGFSGHRSTAELGRALDRLCRLRRL